MKKLLMLVATTMLVVSVNAQEERADNDVVDTRKSVVSLGITAGGNYAMMSNYEPVDLGSRSGIGFQGGLAVNAHFGQRQGADAGTGPIGLQLEVLYSQHNIKTDLSDNIKLGYLEVPLLFKWYITQGLNIELGPTFCYILSKSPDVLSGTSTTIATGELKGGDVKGTVGVSYQTKSGFYASARYNLGFSNLAGNFPCKVSTVSVSIGYLFNIFKF